MSKILEMIDDVLTSVAREQYPADTEYWKTKNKNTLETFNAYLGAADTDLEFENLDTFVKSQTDISLEEQMTKDSMTDEYNRKKDAFDMFTKARTDLDKIEKDYSKFLTNNEGDLYKYLNNPTGALFNVEQITDFFEQINSLESSFSLGIGEGSFGFGRSEDMKRVETLQKFKGRISALLQDSLESSRHQIKTTIDGTVKNYFVPLVTEDDIPFIMKGDVKGISNIKKTKLTAITKRFVKNSSRINRLKDFISKSEMKIASNIEKGEDAYTNIMEVSSSSFDMNQDKEEVATIFNFDISKADNESKGVMFNSIIKSMVKEIEGLQRNNNFENYSSLKWGKNALFDESVATSGIDQSGSLSLTDAEGEVITNQMQNEVWGTLPNPFDDNFEPTTFKNINPALDVKINE